MRKKPSRRKRKLKIFLKRKREYLALGSIFLLLAIFSVLFVLVFGN